MGPAHFPFSPPGPAHVLPSPVSYSHALSRCPTDAHLHRACVGVAGPPLRLLHLAHAELGPCPLPISPPLPRHQDVAGAASTPLSLTLSRPHKNHRAKHPDASLTRAHYFLSALVAGQRRTSS
jgi:hypothetical protein